MREPSRPRDLRCAIYTRKSSEEGLEQDFNSLHAQREACEAYIKSQKHEGWKALSAHYDDGGYSGGSMERPALQRLLADIQGQRIDVVVVYKVDRLTRSLADFAKIVEVFDASNVSFVSVTQAFNTTTSMGRLTLNVLLSFAQFEREVTGERIRDKIAASKKKGLWMGGFVPFGYRARKRTLVINQKEAATVRIIYARYLALGTVTALATELAGRKLRTRAFVSANSSKAWGNRPFSRGHLYRILSSPIYAGKIEHKDQQYDGQHAAIIDRKTFAAVQAQLALNNRQSRTRSRAKAPSLLAGLVVDENGAKLMASHTVKNGKRYRYYVGTRVEQGRSKPWRLPAYEIEAAVIGELRRFLGERQRVAQALAVRPFKAKELKDALWAAEQLGGELGRADSQRATISKLVKGTVVTDDALAIEIKLDAFAPASSGSGANTHRIEVPIDLLRRNGETAVIIQASPAAGSRTDPTLIKAVARGFAWFEELATGQVDTVKALAKRERVTDRYVGQLIEFAFMSPRTVERVLEGAAGMRLTAKNFRYDVDLSPLWSEQERQVLCGSG